MYSGNMLICIPEACSVVLVYTNVWLESSAGELEEGEPRQVTAVSHLKLEGDTSGTATLYLCVLSCPFTILYRMAGNFGGKIFWRVAENMSFGGIYFGG